MERHEPIELVSSVGSTARSAHSDSLKSKGDPLIRADSLFSASAVEAAIGCNLIGRFILLSPVSSINTITSLDIQYRRPRDF